VGALHDRPPATATGECGCPERDGRIYHQQGSCTDPVVARFGWYASDPAAAPGLAAAMAETAYVRDIAGTLIGLFRDSRSDGWRARTSGARLKRLAHEAGLPAPDPTRRDGQALTAYEELDAAFAASLEAIDVLDAQLTEVRRIALQGGQSGESVRRELIAYLEANGGING
jgi:hypothetical protein